MIWIYNRKLDSSITYSNRLFKQTYRFTKSQVQYLINIVREWLVENPYEARGRPISAELQVLSCFFCVIVYRFFLPLQHWHVTSFILIMSCFHLWISCPDKLSSWILCLHLFHYQCKIAKPVTLGNIRKVFGYVTSCMQHDCLICLCRRKWRSCQALIAWYFVRLGWNTSWGSFQSVWD